MGSDDRSTGDSDHPLDEGTVVEYDPAATRKRSRIGEIEDKKVDEWGALYIIRDGDEDHLVSVGESSIISVQNKEDDQ